MTSEEQQLILDLSIRGLPREEFLRRFRPTLDRRDLVLQLLEEALKDRQPDEVEHALTVGFTFGLSRIHLQVLLQLMEEDWHFRHEDLAFALGMLRDPRSIDTLFRATQRDLEYLSDDETRTLAVNAIWALGGIDGPESNEKLHALTLSEDPILVRESIRQIKRRSEASSGSQAPDQ